MFFFSEEAFDGLAQLTQQRQGQLKESLNKFVLFCQKAFLVSETLF